MKNKSIPFLFTFLFSIFGAAAQKNFFIEVTEKNHMGFSRIDQVKWKERKFSINNAPLEKILYPLALSDIQVLKSVRSSANPKNCVLGHFQMKVESRAILGCLEDENYKAVRSSIQHLKYLALLSSE